MRESMFWAFDKIIAATGNAAVQLWLLRWLRGGGGFMGALVADIVQQLDIFKQNFQQQVSLDYALW